MKGLLATLLLLISLAVYAQEGDYLITSHKPSINNIDNTNFQILQDKHGLMYFANRSGVLVYDGGEWDYYSTPGAALSMTFGPKGELFVGCLNDFGLIGYDKNAIHYISLSGKFGKSIGMIYQTLTYRNKVIFVGENALYIYDESKGSTQAHPVEDSAAYYNLLFTLDSTLYSNVSNGTIHRLDKDFKPDSTFNLPDISNLVFLRQNPETGVAIAGTFSGNIYKLNHQSFELLPYSGYITSNNIQLVDGFWYDSKKFVIGTLEKGCLFLDTEENSHHMDTVDFDNGLPDNEVSALYVDNSQGIWVAHEFGLSRISPEIPIRSYSHYPGIQGNLFAMERFNKSLYLSTSVGVYYLDELKKYKRTVYYVRRTPERPSKKEKQVIAGGQPGNKQATVKTERKGFLGLFKRKTRKDQDETALAAATDNTEEKESSRPGFFRRLFSRNPNAVDKISGIANSKDYVRKVRQDLQSVQYVYTPVDGIQAKCKQLIRFHDKLFAVSNSGVYEITDKESAIIINEPARYVFADSAGNRLILCGYDRSVKAYKPIGDLWVELHDISFNETITRACTDQYDNLWLTGTNHIYLVKLTDDQYQIEHTFPFQNQLFDIPMISLINNRLYFIYSMGYLFYDGDTLREDHVFREVIGLPTRSIQSPDGLVWVFNGRVWNRIDRNGKIEQFEYLSLFPDMNFISYDEAHDVFDLLTASNKIYFYDHFRGKKMQPENDLILRRITTNNGLISDHNKIIFTYEDNSLSFKFSEPDYLGLLKVEYQYKLQEQMKVWSEWSPENSVNLNYLQPGKYYLNVRARDTFGRIKEAGVIEFKVNPPYWKQPWFYAAEILVMAVMLIGVKRLRALNIRYPFIVDGLGIFTLIIILALIQSTLQNYFVIKSTPVTDFAMNVVVAILAFPIEQRLRKFLS